MLNLKFVSFFGYYFLFYQFYFILDYLKTIKFYNFYFSMHCACTIHGDRKEVISEHQAC